MKDHELGEIYEKPEKTKNQNKKHKPKTAYPEERTTTTKNPPKKKELERHKWRSALSKKLTHDPKC